MNDSFILYTSYYAIIEGLTDEQLGQLTRALFIYARDGKAIKLEPVVRMAFSFIKDNIDRNADKYQKKCERNRENIRKRWEKKQAEDTNERIDTNVYERIPSNTNVYEEKSRIPYDNDNDNEYDNDNDNEYDVSKETDNNIHTHARETYDEIFEDFGVEPMLKDKLIEFIRHCQLNKKIVTNEKLKNIIVRLDMAHNDDVYGKIQSVQNAISGGYFDVIESKR